MAIHLVYFSPGGTTQKTVRTIAKGIGGEVIEHDMLKQENRRKKITFSEDDLVVLGMMTCAKLFGAPKQVLDCLHGNNTPIVGVAMYGNGMYGSSLQQMRKETQKRGFTMIAAGAFIGQNGADPAIATGRPDASDLQTQLQFGQDIAHKLLTHSDCSLKKDLPHGWAPDTFSNIKCLLFKYLMPTGMVKMMAPFNALKTSDACVHCGKCEQRCPTGAMNSTTNISDSKKCIGCLACVNGCPVNAIAYVHPAIVWAANHVKPYWQKQRREPELFL